MNCRVFPKLTNCVLFAAFCFSVMAAETGNLRITCEPGIRIYFDNEFAGVAKSEEGGLHLEAIEPGKHEVRIGEAEFRPQRFNVQIKAAKTTEIKIGKDGAPMVPIPAGEFQMGSNDGEPDEQPAHTIYLDAFYMDMYEVTNALYRKFMDATGHEAPRYWNDPKCNAPDQPVVGVTWHDARAYCDWAGKRLPTEAEWEKAARGGLAGKTYPWGDNEDTAAPGAGGNEGVSGAFPVGSFAPNGYGLYDMARNAWEWCADWYGEDYYPKSPGRNPKGPDSGENRVLRGGSWFAGISTPLPVSYRYSYNPEHASNLIGFRCVEWPADIRGLRNADSR
jgi:sulfatase modifying factor 1